MLKSPLQDKQLSLSGHLVWPELELVAIGDRVLDAERVCKLAKQLRCDGLLVVGESLLMRRIVDLMTYQLTEVNA